MSYQRVAVRTNVLALALLCLSCASSTPSGSQRGSPNHTTDQKRDQVLVEVVDLETRTRISGARVFVLSEDGRELATAYTDSSGTAILPLLTRDLRPKYVLVHHQAFFISGQLWRDRAREYYIVVTILRVAGF